MALKEPNQNKTRRELGSSISEFPVALFVFFLFALFPLFNLMQVVVSAATLALLTTDLATRASTQTTYQYALNNTVSETNNFLGLSFRTFIGLLPQAGYSSKGFHLYVLVTPIGSGATTTYGPDSPLPAAPPTLDVKNFIYEYMVNTTYTVRPMIPMTGVPWIGSVPGLGQPAELTWSATRTAEYPLGVQAPAAAGANGSSTLSIDSKIPAPFPPYPGTWINPIVTPPGTGWRTPTIYHKITGTGQTVVAQSTIVVPANTPNAPVAGGAYVDSGLTIASGQTVWIDSHASGIWGGGASSSYPSGMGPCDANGYTPLLVWFNPLLTGRIDAVNLPASNPTNPYGTSFCTLVAYIGSPPVLVINPNPPVNGPPPPPPPPPAKSLPMPPATPGWQHFFTASDAVTGYVPPAGISGELYFINNDTYRVDDPGQQLVRVTITQ